MPDEHHDTDTHGGPKPLFDRIFAFMETTAIMAAAEIGLADTFADGPRTSAQVAAELGADEHRIDRLLRDLTGTGVIERAGAKGFTLGPQGPFLRSGVPDRHGRSTGCSPDPSVRECSAALPP